MIKYKSKMKLKHLSVIGARLDKVNSELNLLKSTNYSKNFDEIAKLGRKKQALKEMINDIETLL